MAMIGGLELRAWLQLIGIAAACGWTSCLAIGLSLFSPTKAVAVGLAGIACGTALCEIAGLPTGPISAEVPIIPAFAGTLLVAFFVELVVEARQAAAELRQAASAKALPRGWEQVQAPERLPELPPDATTHEERGPDPRIDG